MGLVQPNFSGRKSEWTNFELEWERYIIRAAAGGDLPDSVKLALFEGCLDDTNQKHLKLLQTKKVGLTFVEFFAIIKGKYARDQTLGARRFLARGSTPQFWENKWRRLGRF